MRIAIWLLSLFTLSSVVSAQDAFCVKYSKALFGASNKTTNYALLNAVVARVTVGCNNDLAQAFGVQGLPAGSPYAAYAPQACGNAGVTVVPGLVSDALNAPFFAGTAPFFASATNASKLNAFANPKVLTAAGFSIPFVGVNATTRAVTPFAATLGGMIASPTVATGVFSEGLITHLITFFGAALGCDSIDNTKDTVIQPAANTFIGRYNGVVNMTLVHQGMAINNAVWNEFANTFVLALKSFGVTQADIDGTIVPYVSQFLRGPAGSSNVICNQPDCACAPQFVLAANGQCVAPAPTFCQKYAKAVFGASTTNTQYALLNAVIARVTVGCNNNLAQAFGVQGLPAGSPYAAYAAQACGNNGLTVVPGLVSDPLNAPFFAGTAPSFTSVTNAAALNAFVNPPVLTAAGKSIPFVGVNATTRAVTPFAATLGGNIAVGNFQEGLITHLISFFGRDLGCDIVPGQNTMIAPTNKAFIGKYNGSPNMTAVHAGMGITFAVWNEFAATFVNTLKSFGVTQADIDGTIVPYVSKFLRGPAGTDNVICNGADCPCAPQFNTVTVGATTQCVVPPPDTFCQKYSKALFGASTRATNYQLLNAVVARVVVGCNNNLAQAFGVQGVPATSPFAAYAPQVCGNNGVAMVAGLVQDPLNAPFFAGTVAYKSVTGLGDLNVKSPPPAVAGVTFASPSIRFVGVNATSHNVAPYAATTGLNITGVISEGLIQHLIAFFGRDLGCDVDTTQNTLQVGANPFIGKYNGVNSMTAVHAGMQITQFVWDEFVTTFVQALKSFGVAQTDIDGTVKPYLAQFLNGPANSNNVICNQPSCMCAAPFVKDATGNCVVATTTVPPTIAPAKPTFCGKYAAALFPADTAAVAEYKLLQAVIARVILGCDNNLATAFGVAGVAGNADYAAFQASACGNVAGFAQVKGLVSDPLNAPFFDGTAPNFFSVTQALALNLANNVSQTIFNNARFVTVNGFSVTAHPAALGGTVPFDPAFGLPASMRMPVEGLITHLIAFFGRDLGCQSIDVAQNTKVTPITNARIGKYNGATSMFQVHAGMKITQAVWNEFANTFIGALKSFGVTQTDIDQTIVPYVSQFLRGPTNMADMMICNQPDCACAPQFQLVNGQCIDPKNQNPNVGANGQTGKVGSATTTWASPIIVMVVSIMTYLLA